MTEGIWPGLDQLFMIIKNEFTKQKHSVTERRGLAIAICNQSRYNVFPVLFTGLHGKTGEQREDKDRMSFPCKVTHQLIS